MNHSQRHNFTNISGHDLQIGEKHRGFFSPLLYYRVLKTSELMKRSGYAHGAKSFHKLLNRFKRLDLIGSITEEQFSEQFIYPKVKLIEKFRGNRFKNFMLHDEELDTIRLYWQMGQIYEVLTKLKENSESESYMNNKGPYFDFRFDFFGEVKRLRFGMYAFFYPTDDLAYLEKLKDNGQQAYIDFPLLFTSSWDEAYLKLLIERMPKLAFCHFDKSFVNKKQFLSAKLITHNLTTTLENFVTKEAQNVTDECMNFKTNPERNNSLWKSMKEIFT